jgi:hypothetical protein
MTGFFGLVFLLAGAVAQELTQDVVLTYDFSSANPMDACPRPRTCPFGGDIKRSDEDRPPRDGTRPETLYWTWNQGPTPRCPYQFSGHNRNPRDWCFTGTPYGRSCAATQNRDCSDGYLYLTSSMPVAQRGQSMDGGRNCNYGRSFAQLQVSSYNLASCPRGIITQVDFWYRTYSYEDRGSANLKVRARALLFVVQGSARRVCSTRAHLAFLPRSTPRHPLPLPPHLSDHGRHWRLRGHSALDVVD